MYTSHTLPGTAAFSLIPRLHRCASASQGREQALIAASLLK
jgi:hypothetical protein